MPCAAILRIQRSALMLMWRDRCDEGDEVTDGDEAQLEDQVSSTLIVGNAGPLSPDAASRPAMWRDISMYARPMLLSGSATTVGLPASACSRMRISKGSSAS